MVETERVEEPGAQRVEAILEPGTSVDQIAAVEAVEEPTAADAVVTAVKTAATRLPTHEDPHLLARAGSGWGEATTRGQEQPTTVVTASEMHAAGRGDSHWDDLHLPHES